MAAAYDAGVNFFDNAEVYAEGQSETIMGEALEEARLAPLVVHRLDQVLLGPARRARTRRTRSTASTCCRRSTARSQRLQLDYVDLVFCHRPDPDTPIEETVWAMHDIIARRQGALLGHVGMERGRDHGRPGRSPSGITCAKPVMEQPQYNLFHRERVEDGIRARSTTTSGLGTTTWSPLASGLLTGKYNDGVPAGSRADAQGLRMARRAHRRSGDDSRRCDGSRRSPRDLGCTLAQLCARVVRQNPHVVAP